LEAPFDLSFLLSNGWCMLLVPFAPASIISYVLGRV
jgi:hypothetical protein